jgi:hypothetical protein
MNAEFAMAARPTAQDAVLVRLTIPAVIHQIFLPAIFSE